MAVTTCLQTSYFTQLFSLHIVKIILLESQRYSIGPLSTLGRVYGLRASGFNIKTNGLD